MTSLTHFKPYKPDKHPKNTARIFQRYGDERHVFYSQIDFLEDLWWHHDGAHDPVFAFLAFKDIKTGTWINKPIDVSDFSRRVIGNLLERYSRWDFDQYFCPNVFSERRRLRRFALPTRYGWCDMDSSDPHAYDPWPSLIWETSPDRYQALWLWDREHAPNEAEAYSRALTYRHGGDRNGWSCTKMLRLIGSVNHKPEYDKPFVQTRYCDWSRIEARPVLLPTRRNSPLSPLPDIDVDPTRFDRLDVIRRYRDKLHDKARHLMGHRKVYEEDRSGCIFFMIMALHEAGASPDEIGSVVWNSAYFISKHERRLDKLNEEIARVIAKAESEK